MYAGNMEEQVMANYNKIVGKHGDITTESYRLSCGSSYCRDHNANLVSSGYVINRERASSPFLAHECGLLAKS